MKYIDVIKFLEKIFIQIENIKILIENLDKTNIINLYKIRLLELQIIKLKTNAKIIANKAADII
jgi:hypothetical protein